MKETVRVTCEENYTSHSSTHSRCETLPSGGGHIESFAEAFLCPLRSAWKNDSQAFQVIESMWSILFEAASEDESRAAAASLADIAAKSLANWEPA